MQISTIPTRYIVVKAHCQSEWDSVDFAIIDLNNIKAIVKRTQYVQELGDFIGSDLCHVEVVDYSAEYFVNDDQTESWRILPDNDPEAKEWHYIDITPEEMEMLTRPESPMDCKRILYGPDGSVQFDALGKYSGESYSTEGIKVSDLYPEEPTARPPLSDVEKRIFL